MAFVVYTESAARARKFVAAAHLHAPPGAPALRVEAVSPAAAAAHAAVLGTPFRSLPVLEAPGGLLLPRTSAILRYLAAVAPGAGAPPAPALAGAVDAWLEFAFGELEPLVALAGDRARAEAAGGDAALAARLLPARLAFVDAHLAPGGPGAPPSGLGGGAGGGAGGRTWLAGDRFSIADIAVAGALAEAWEPAASSAASAAAAAPAAGDASAASDAATGGPRGAYPHLSRWYAGARAQPAMVAAFGAPPPAPAAAPGVPPPPAPPAAAAPAAGASAGAAGGAPAVAPAAAPGGALTPAAAAALARSGGAVVGTGAATAIPGSFRRGRVRVSELLAAGEALAGASVTVCGWVKTLREGGAGTLAFVALSDGSCFETLQVVADKATLGDAAFAALTSCGGTGASLRVEGALVKSPAKGQSVELAAAAVAVVGTVADPATYAIAKKKHSLEFLREVQHLRPRTNTVGAVARVRNACAYATHRFFQERGFLYVHTPVITTADCEGAGEMFQVTTIAPPAGVPGADVPRAADKSVDYKKDFFGKPAMLTVSGQLQVEAYACALSDVYTFGPTFRAEDSHTSRHLAEFWMIEPEIAFATLAEDMALAEDYLKFATAWVLEHCAADLAFFEATYEPGLTARLANVVAEPFARLTYTDAVALLLRPEHAAAGKFANAVYWGCDLASEHERYITEVVYKKPVILTDYPKEIKAFYMKLNPDGKTVAAMDVLVPKIGELMGGSQREDNLEKLAARMAEMHVAPEPLSFYLDLRKYGTCPHAGFGLGFERLVMYVTGMENIRDAIPFPRWPGNAAL